ncbi:MAG: hypothetical protein OHK0035_34290 [Cyanobacteria bacterium J069]
MRPTRSSLIWAIAPGITTGVTLGVVKGAIERAVCASADAPDSGSPVAPTAPTAPTRAIALLIATLNARFKVTFKCMVVILVLTQRSIVTKLAVTKLAVTKLAVTKLAVLGSSQYRTCSTILWGFAAFH